jgi:Spy/CpxP family protein refolding chaperone
MTRKTQICGFFILAAITASSAACAQENAPAPNAMEHKKGGHGDEIGSKMDQALGLTAEQKTKMHALRESFMPAQKALREELKTRKDALRAVLESDKPDRTQADTLAGAINTLQQKMMNEHINHLFMIREILTAEQYRKFEQMRKKHLKNGRSEHGMGKRSEQDKPSN